MNILELENKVEEDEIIYPEVSSQTINSKKTEIIDGIDSFSKLEYNWDGYGAIPSGVESLSNAKKFITALPDEIFHNFYDGYPNTHGTLSFEWKNDNDDEFFIEIGKKLISYYLILNGQKAVMKDHDALFNLQKISTIISYIKKLDVSK